MRCFTSPRSPPTPIHSVPGDTTSLVPGFPIRTSSDPRSVDSSPRHNAASNVLHRLPVPRHPPCALKHLQHKKPEKNKKLHHNKPHTPRRTPTGPTQTQPPERSHTCGLMLATTIHKSNTTPHHQDGATPDPLPAGRTSPSPVSHTRDEGTEGLLPQSPIVCPAVPPPRPAPKDRPQQRF